MNKLFKRTVTLGLVGAMVVGTGVFSFANETDKMPTLYGNEPTMTLYNEVPTPTLINAVPTLYDNGLKPVLISENPIAVPINALPGLAKINENFVVEFNGEAIEYSVKPQIIDGRIMLPLAETLDVLGFDYEWKNETRSIDILKGNQFTTIYIDKNAYFRNKMAPAPLSSAPVIVEGRTMVPVEFFVENRGYGVEVEEGNLIINEEETATHRGLIREAKVLEDGGYTLTIANDMETEELADMTIIHISAINTLINVDNFDVGTTINAICPPVMTMSIPAQTSAYVIY